MPLLVSFLLKKGSINPVREARLTLSIRILAMLSVCAVAASPALAELPAPVRAMLDTAIASGNEADIATVAKIAKASNPADAAEIDALVAAHSQAVAQAALARKQEAGFFDDWHGSGELGGSIATGNTKSTGLSAGLTLTKEGIKWRHRFRAAADYLRSDGVTTRNQWLASYEPNYNLSEHLYIFGLAMYEKDRFQGFDNRVTASGGLGYRVIDSAPLTLDVKAGPAWRRTNWILEPDSSELEGLAGADLVWHIAPGIDFSDNAQALIGSDNSTYSNTASLTAKLNGALSARFSFGAQHESSPPPGTKKTDTITRATLVYGF